MSSEQNTTTMKKLKTIFLALNLFLGAILCLGNSTIKTVNDGVPITITKTSFNSGYDRSSSISAHISGHYLNVAFLADGVREMTRIVIAH